MAAREGNLEAPTRHPLDWKNPDFYNEDLLNEELERVYDICHGCRRCVSLCDAFPTLFDLVDESDTFEVDGVDKKDFVKVVDQCYLCDLCYMTKCPYTPPHEWNVDFPHLMLRAKAIKHKKGDFKTRDKILSATDKVGNIAGIPVVSTIVNAANENGLARKALQKVLGIHPDATVPKYHSKTGRKLLASTVEESKSTHADAKQAGRTTGKVAIFATCYGNRNEPHLLEDLGKVLHHNQIAVSLVDKEVCCGMPKLELGDLKSVEHAKNINIPEMVKKIDAGWDIIAPVPSCVLMFKQELPLMFPDDADVQKVKAHIFDPFEYLMLRHKEELLNIDFKKSLGKIAYHAACHLRVQNMGLKTRDLLQLVQDTTIETIERCSGHDGTYAVKEEFHEKSMKICRPVITKVQKSESDFYSSDCPMAGHQIANGMKDDSEPQHPLTLLRMAYGL
ncbi:heterodisulfide reductase-related iron-sulfur binding cluster [Cocleimonas flava]|uniref:Fe-S oxidoreductase n=1 Tax=Cocleimonas flava TaxID=634765 RepID=A0A4R1F5I0_9GAMM|nr:MULTISPECIES: heterodisulfide reductase-related iron-sulfur binding cluster [Cocleimonas]MEB8431474.1 heterodisulfide reductase-related iron-sulfur binding cluster [Cocleimonas sp. KMM 6892]MEC4713754.1 heterodisulfide reductase-related iron-sulfur binding cluster [Cocleimonas sp. KMM 6895]MEC4743085.1 heterodisulfide reductase-related iron-sulfur binding cluster [Cocleimonas sp. KMM 6896]TCJ89153.1 Fe-S oxidoreductase [Cocleimonas flava]